MLTRFALLDEDSIAFDGCSFEDAAVSSKEEGLCENAKYTGECPRGPSDHRRKEVNQWGSEFDSQDGRRRGG